jgi:hypothetical protein
VRAATEAISHLAPAFGLQSQPPRIISPTRPSEPVPTASGFLPSPSRNDIVDEVDNSAMPPHGTKSTVGANHKASALFEADGDGSLTAIEKDFKGKNKKDQQKRFALLYVWAYHQLIGQPMPSREHMLAAAKKAHLFDSAFARYFDELVRESLYPSGTGLKVKPQEEAGLVQEILAEIDNRSITGAPYWKGSLRTKSKRARLSGEEEQTVIEWVSLELNIGPFDIRSLQNGTNYAMFAFWALTRKLRVAPAAKPKMAFRYLKERYKTISIKLRGFTDALSRPSNSTKFKRNEDGLYYITEEAEREVVSWLEGAPIPQRADPVIAEVDDDDDEDDE